MNFLPKLNFLKTFCAAFTLLFFFKIGSISAQRFTCNTDFYHLANSRLFKLDLTTNTYIPVGINYPAYSNSNNAGYNTEDDYIYSYMNRKSDNTFVMVRVDSNGDFLDLGPVAGVANQQQPIGTFDLNGNYYLTGQNNTVYVIDIDAGMSVTTFTANNSGYNDWVYNPVDNFLYGVNANQLIKIDPGTGSRTTIALNPTIPSGRYGAVWVDNTGTIYASNNDTGEIFLLDVTTGTSLFIMSTGTSSNVNDGANCPLSSSPFPCSPLSFEVTNTNDSGAGSLRCAIDFANLNPEPNVISFNIPGTPPHVINLLSELPALTDPGTEIKGNTQPGWSLGDIELDGTGNFRGTLIYAEDCLVQGIHFTDFDTYTIVAHVSTTFGRSGHDFVIDECAFSNSKGTMIGMIETYNGEVKNCQIGLDITGSIDDSGASTIGIGVITGSSDITIDNCTISGFNGTNDLGVFMQDCTNAVIQNCQIGTDITGSSAVPNYNGIRLDNCTNFLIQNNVISNNISKGILVE